MHLAPSPWQSRSHMTARGWWWPWREWNGRWGCHTVSRPRWHLFGRRDGRMRPADVWNTELRFIWSEYKSGYIEPVVEVVFRSPPQVKLLITHYRKFNKNIKCTKMVPVTVILLYMISLDYYNLCINVKVGFYCRSWWRWSSFWKIFV